MNQYPAYKESDIEWLGEVPAHWETASLKHVAEISPDKLRSKEVSDDYKIRYVDIGNVNSLGEVEDEEEMCFGDAPSRARYVVEDGDTIVSTVRTYLRAIAYMADPPENRVVSTGFAVLRPTAKFYPPFLGKLASTTEFVDAVVANSTGVSYPAINSSRLGDLPVWIPPLPEQRTIAAYLDRKTAQIDTLIAKKQRLIDLLQEQRTAIINRAVTQGLDPDVPMQDSGIEWLGEVPAHWEVAKVKYLTEIQRGKFSHRPRNDPRFYDGEYPFIQTGDVSDAGKYITSYEQTLNEKGYAVSKEFPKGTVVMTIAANIGDIGVLTFDSCFPDSIVGLVPSNNVVDNYLYYALVSMNEEFHRTSTQNTQLNLNVERIGNSMMPCPPREEQARIASYLDDKLSEMRRLINEEKTAIQLLQELRTSLISEVVTGKLDVRDEVSEPAEVAA